jgi:hypothetical protein
MYAVFIVVSAGGLFLATWAAGRPEMGLWIALVMLFCLVIGWFLQ